MENRSATIERESYVWEIAGKPVAVRLDFDLLDRLLHEILRGFGVVPKRGVEMGGVLLGTVQTEGGRQVVYIQDFEPVACRHTQGLTYVLSDEEQKKFNDTVTRWDRSQNKGMHAVGFYRGHTREGLGLSETDLDTYQNLFPDPSAVVLLVKPFATRVSTGAFFFREDGEVRGESSYLEFPFRRKELSGETENPEPKPERGRRSQPVETEMRGGTEVPPSNAASASPSFTDDTLKLGLPVAKVDESTGRRIKSGWVWIPLSFIFLLLGVVLGFQVALSVRSQLPAGLRQDPYTLNMTVTPAADSLHVRWDRAAAAIQASSRGTLIIIHGDAQRNVDLDAGQLQNGSVIYKWTGGDVRFRLEVYARDRVTVSETVDYKTAR